MCLPFKQPGEDWAALSSDWLRRQGTWFWLWMASCPSLPKSLHRPLLNIFAVSSSPRRHCMFWSRVLLSCIYGAIHLYSTPVVLVVRCKSPSFLAAFSCYLPKFSHTTPLFCAGLPIVTQIQFKSVLASEWWLPTDIRTAGTLSIYCFKVKTHLFRLDLGPWPFCSLKYTATIILHLFFL